MLLVCAMMEEDGGCRLVDFINCEEGLEDVVGFSRIARDLRLKFIVAS